MTTLGRWLRGWWRGWQRRWLRITPRWNKIGWMSDFLIFQGPKKLVSHSTNIWQTLKISDMVKIKKFWLRTLVILKFDIWHGQTP